MKIISIRQPWASLIVQGVKDIENRAWRTRATQLAFADVVETLRSVHQDRTAIVSPFKESE